MSVLDQVFFRMQKNNYETIIILCPSRDRYLSTQLEILVSNIEIQQVYTWSSYRNWIGESNNLGYYHLVLLNNIHVID
jgi:hypothetical protein